MYKFTDYQKKEITLQEPFICVMEEILNYNSDTKIAVCSLKDDSGVKIVGFCYNKFAKLLSNRHVKDRFPFSISIIAGKIKKQGQKLIFEIYQCIFEKDFLINSSSLASHSFCEMSTYLSTHIHAFSPYNPAQIFGNVYHDYLMFVFEDESLLKLSVGSSDILHKIKIAFQKAIYHNWQSLAAFNVDEEAYIDYFVQYYAEKELEFINYELEKLHNFGADYKFQAEIMVRSSIFGLQGRIDRILWNQTDNSFTLYETKTGRTSFASENTAKFQLMAYSLILTEYYSRTMEELLLEYPRNNLSERLKFIEFNENEIIRLITMRNEIWAISIGRRPFDGPFKGCSQKCFQKDACSFYCLRSFLTKNCLNCERCNYYPILTDQTSFEEFRRVNVYYDWFYQFLEMEYLNNQDLISELGLPAKERESLGNCFADVKISKIDKTIHSSNNEYITAGKFWITFTKASTIKDRKSFSNSRMHISDYVLITPQNYRPLTLQSIPASIYEIQNDILILEVSNGYFSLVSDFINDEIFRIDMMTSNRIVNMEKTALDSFLRVPYLSGYHTLKKIRNLLINFNPIIDENQNLSTQIGNELLELGYNENQTKAIQRALSFSDLLLIQGPPGTGKTTAITEIVKRLVKNLVSIPNSRQEEINLNTKSDESDKEKKDNHQEEKKLIPDFPFERKKTTKKILLTAFTNRAVDTLVEMIKEKYPEIDILRLGSILSMSPKVHPYSLELQAQKRISTSINEDFEAYSSKMAHDLIQNATVIASTCLGSNSVLLQNVEFEYVIVDEAGQVIEPAALIPVLKAKKVILVGDDSQLPPISVKEQNPLLDSDYFTNKNYLENYHGTILQYQDRSSNLENRRDIFLQELEKLGIMPRDTLSISLFQRLKRKMKGSSHFVLLNEQYRMHKTISDFISQEFYEGKLVPGKINNISIGDRTIETFYTLHKELLPSIENPQSLNTLFGYVFYTKKPMIFIDTKEIHAPDSKLDEKFDEMSSIFNYREANILSLLIFKFVSSYLKKQEVKELSEHQEFLSNICVITPYRAQVGKIRSELNKIFKKSKLIDDSITDYILVDTVDKFQGKESEIILISLADSNPSYKLSSLYSELRRINVSMTRAKTKLIFIGNSGMFTGSTQKKSRSILDYMAQDLSKDSNVSTSNLKNSEEIHRFFSDLVKYIQNHKGYVILDEKMLEEEE